MQPPRSIQIRESELEELREEVAYVESWLTSLREEVINKAVKRIPKAVCPKTVRNNQVPLLSKIEVAGARSLKLHIGAKWIQIPPNRKGHGRDVENAFFPADSLLMCEIIE